MSRLDVVRAWKDEEYFSSLSETERGSLPQNPAGLVELSDAELGSAEGGEPFTTTIFTISALGSCYSCVTCITITITIPVTHLTVSTT